MISLPVRLCVRAFPSVFPAMPSNWRAYLSTPARSRSNADHCSLLGRMCHVYGRQGRLRIWQALVCVFSASSQEQQPHFFSHQFCSMGEASPGEASALDAQSLTSLGLLFERDCPIFWLSPRSDLKGSGVMTDIDGHSDLTHPETSKGSRQNRL